jgi:hypothetical protein
VYRFSRCALAVGLTALLLAPTRGTDWPPAADTYCSNVSGQADLNLGAATTMGIKAATANPRFALAIRRVGSADTGVQFIATKENTNYPPVTLTTVSPVLPAAHAVRVVR